MERYRAKLSAILDDSEERQKALSYYNNKLQANHAATEHILKAVERGLGTSALLLRLNDLEEEKKALMGEIASLKMQDLPFTKDSIKFFLYRMLKQGEESREKYKERVIRSFIYQVQLFDDKVVITYNITDDNVGLNHIFALREADTGLASTSDSDTCAAENIEGNKKSLAEPSGSTSESSMTLPGIEPGPSP